MEKERILVTVKTYPTLSTKYGETVCTAGLRPDGTWVRIYPVPFRRLDQEQQYKKFDWIECQLVRNTKDRRPESFRPFDQLDLQTPVGHLGTDHNWRERRQVILKTARVYDSLDEIIAGAKANTMSLATFKPSQILDFTWKAEDREWPTDKVIQLQNATNQPDLFTDNAWRETFKIVNRLPYCFSYRFKDANDRESNLQIIDWETGALYWNCLRDADGDEQKALQKVRQKYMDEFLKTDLHFFLGTLFQFHSVSPNPWLIVGVLPIPFEKQIDLFDC